MNKKYYAISHHFKDLKIKSKKRNIKIPKYLYDRGFHLNKTRCPGEYCEYGEECTDINCSSISICKMVAPFYSYIIGITEINNLLNTSKQLLDIRTAGNIIQVSLENLDLNDNQKLDLLKPFITYGEAHNLKI